MTLTFKRSLISFFSKLKDVQMSPLTKTDLSLQILLSLLGLRRYWFATRLKSSNKGLFRNYYPHAN